MLLNWLICIISILIFTIHHSKPNFINMYLISNIHRPSKWLVKSLLFSVNGYSRPTLSSRYYSNIDMNYVPIFNKWTQSQKINIIVNSKPCNTHKNIYTGPGRPSKLGLCNDWRWQNLIIYLLKISVFFIPAKFLKSYFAIWYPAVVIACII